MSRQEDDNRIRQDLERRIEILENMEDEDFGSFTRMDYILLIVGAVLVPILAMILAR